MANKILGYFCAIIALCAALTMVSCDNTDLNELSLMSEDITPKDGNPGLTIDIIIDKEPSDSAVAKSTVYGNDTIYPILANIRAAQYDYIIERIYKDLNVAYCNKDENKTLSGLGTSDVVANFKAEDGNIYTVTVKAPVLGMYGNAQRPYWLVKDVVLTSLRNYDEVADTLYTEVQAEVQLTSTGVSPMQMAFVTLKDSVRRVMLAEDDIVVGRKYNWTREPKSETLEEILVTKNIFWKSGRTTEANYMQLLPRSIVTIALGEQQVDNFGTFKTFNAHTNTGTTVSDTETQASPNFENIVKREDAYTSSVSDGKYSFSPVYRVISRGVTFNDGDTTFVIPVVDWQFAEMGNVLAPTTGSIANAEYKTMTNNVRATYLEYVHNVSEVGTLYKLGDDVIDEHWDTEHSYLKVVGKDVIAHGVWITVYRYSDPTSTPFDTTFVRGMRANNWEIYSTKDNTTGNNILNSSFIAKNHGPWSWKEVSNTITESVVFATGTKQNVYNGTEYAEISLTNKNKKLSFQNYSYEYSEGSVNQTSAGTSGDYNVYKQNTTVTSTAAGNQTISATAVGTIYDKITTPDNPDLPYGKFEDAKFSATVNPYVANSWYFGAAITFSKGTLAVPIDQSGNPDWEHGEFWPGIKDPALNGAFYVARYGKWYPVIASDLNACMQWALCAAQGNYGLYALDYSGADTYGDWNNNDKGHNGQHTVHTDRLKIEDNPSTHTITLFYNGVNKGSWTYGE